MSDRIGGLRQQFERNFDTNIVKDNAQQTQDKDGDVKGKGKGKGGVGATGPNDYPTNTSDAFHTTGAEPVQVQVMQYMMDAYNSNTDDIMDKVDGYFSGTE